MENKTIEDLIHAFIHLDTHIKAMIILGLNFENTDLGMVQSILGNAILDLLGVPEDTYEFNEDSPEGSKGYSRDLWFEELVDFANSDESIEEFVVRIKDESSKIS